MTRRSAPSSEASILPGGNKVLKRSPPIRLRLDTRADLERILRSQELTGNATLSLIAVARRQCDVLLRYAPRQHLLLLTRSHYGADNDMEDAPTPLRPLSGAGEQPTRVITLGASRVPVLEHRSRWLAPSVQSLHRKCKLLREASGDTSPYVPEGGFTP